VYELIARAGITRGVTWTIGDTPLVIGRDMDCSVRIADASVSRRHCLVLMRGGEAWIEDLGSRNTTLVNGRPVKKHRLAAGDEIVVGPVRLLFRAQEGAAANAAPERCATQGSTVTLAQNAVAYLRHDCATMFERDLSRTVADLADLFQLSQHLWAAKSSDGAIEVFMRWCRDRLRSVNARFYLLDDPTDIHSLNEAYGEGDCPPSLDKHLAVALGSRSGLLVPLSVHRAEILRVQTLAVAPVVLHDEVLGAVALVSGNEIAAYDESDLQLLMAGANSFAPFLRSLLLIEQIRSENEQLRLAHPDKPVLVGTSRAMGRLRNAVRQAAQTTLPVIIQGETGTGKELVAHLIHELSARRAGPYHAINCAAIPRELFESELFGYERGAFTGAMAAKPGIVKVCDHGTLFLDEIADLSLENQAKLLRFIETGVFRPVGGTRDIRVDVRLVAATNRELTGQIERGMFRKDLFYRLDGLMVRTPSLAERPSDIPALVHHFIELARRHRDKPVYDASQDVLDHVTQRGWPGNVRELRHAVHRAIARCKGSHLTVEDFSVPAQPAEDVLKSLEQHEADYIARVLRHHGGRVGVAAKALGIGRTTLYEKMARYGLRHDEETAT
jgi:two-component system, NtrC family, response regulator HydG